MGAIQCCSTAIDRGVVIDEARLDRPTMPPSSRAVAAMQASNMQLPFVREGLTSKVAAAERTADHRRRGGGAKLLGDDGETAEGTGALVQVAATQILKVAGIAAYHTSIIIGNEEYYFDDDGIASAPALWSHVADATVEGFDITCTEVIAIARSELDGEALIAKLTKFYQEGTYDILLKNCNAFTDAALYCLTRTRLDSRFSRLERFLAGTRPVSTKMISALLSASGVGCDLGSGMTQTTYAPNPQAEGFSVQAVIDHFDKTEGFPSGLESSSSVPGVPKASNGRCNATCVGIVSGCLRTSICCEETPLLHAGSGGEWDPGIATDEVSEDFEAALIISPRSAALKGITPAANGRTAHARTTAHPRCSGPPVSKGAVATRRSPAAGGGAGGDITGKWQSTRRRPAQPVGIVPRRAVLM